MIFEVYCDGSATTADKPGGYAYVLCKDGIKFAEGSGHLSKATNNVAEITAAIRGLEALAASSEFTLANTQNTDVIQQVNGSNGTQNVCSIVLVSDSQLTLRYATGEYTCRKPHLIPLYIQLRKHYRATGATTRWVKGHSGDEHNERCDVLAKAARAQPQGQSTQSVTNTTVCAEVAGDK